MAIEELTQKSAGEVLRDTDRDSVGVLRVLSSQAGRPGEEREYELGDEALVEAGLAEWVVAPVYLPSAGRRLDTDAEREPTPLDGVEAYPPAEPTSAARRAEARERGFVAAHIAEGVGEKLAARRLEVARGLSGAGGDAKTQAELGSLGARSGPVTARSDLAADKRLAEAATAPTEPGEGGGGAAGRPRPTPAAGAAGGERK